MGKAVPYVIVALVTLVLANKLHSLPLLDKLPQL